MLSVSYLLWQRLLDCGSYKHGQKNHSSKPDEWFFLRNLPTHPNANTTANHTPLNPYSLSSPYQAYALLSPYIAKPISQTHHPIPTPPSNHLSRLICRPLSAKFMLVIFNQPIFAHPKTPSIHHLATPPLFFSATFQTTLYPPQPVYCIAPAYSKLNSKNMLNSP